MNIGQMHISVQHGVDKINAMHSDLLLSEEIDLELNKAIGRFINTRFNPRGNKYQAGFEMSQKRIDDLRTLIVEASQITAYKGNIFDDIYIDAGFLPDDYLHLVNLKSLILYNGCNTYDWSEVASVIGSIQLSFEPDITISGLPASFVSYDGAFLGFEPDVTLGSSPFYTGLTTPTPPGQVTTLAQMITWVLDPANWNLTYVENIVPNGATSVTVTLKAGIVAYGSSTCYIEPGSLIQGASFPLGLPITSTIPSFSSTSTYANKRINSVDGNGNPLPYTTTVGKNKFIQHDDIFTVLSDPFNVTTYKTPLYTIKENYIEVYTDETFIVDRIKLTYLKEPAIVNLANTVNCDLPDHTHREIIDMVVNSILEGISDPRYQSSNIETLKSE